MSSERIFANLSGGFGALALVLACIGIYGMMAYEVASRTGEIGIRMALGAQTGQVVGMVLGQVWWMAAFGAALGTGSALWLATLVRAMLYGLSPVDPITLAGAAALLTLVALVGGCGPALRAARVDPAQALRSE
jgi:ABC-type antimicrobial peptide transport system permease subunit